MAYQLSHFPVTKRAKFRQALILIILAIFTGSILFTANAANLFTVKASTTPAWTTYTNTGTITKIAFSGNTGWAGTSHGAVKFDKQTGAILATYNRSLTGLIGAKVNAIQVDRQGNVWFGTNDGISKFDGTTWTSITTSNSHLPDNFARAATIDHKGNIWFALQSGLAEFNGTNWQFFVRPTKPSESNQMFPNTLVVDSHDNVFIGSGDSGLFKFDGTTFTQINHLVIEAMVIDANDLIWTVGIAGLITVEGLKQNTIIKANQIFHEIALDSTGNKWLAGDKGLTKYNGSSTVFNKANSGLSNDHVTAITLDSAGNKWVADNKLALDFHEATSVLNKFTGTTSSTYFTNINQISSNYVTCVAIDKANDKWFVTSEGLSVLNGQNWFNYTISNSGLPTNTVYYVTVDQNGAKWIGTANGLTFYDGQHWFTYNTSNSGIPNNHVYRIRIDRNNTKWLYTDAGLSKFTGTTWHTYSLLQLGLPPTNPFLVGINALREDNTNPNLIWVGTYDGISKFDGTKVITYTASNSGLIFDAINSISIDGDGNKWFGTANGVSKFDGTHWTTYNHANSGLASDSVNSTRVDGHNNIWFTSYYPGTSKLNLTTGIWTNYTQATSDIISAVNYGLNIDNLGHIWFTGDGVSEFRP